MRLLFAFLADYAAASPTDGKLSIVGGGFDTMLVQGFPANVSMAVVTKIEFEPRECGVPYLVEISPVDADGRGFLATDKLSHQAIPPRNPFDPTLPGSMQLLINLQAVPIKKAGTYSFLIQVNGKVVGSVPFHVRATSMGASVFPPQRP